jgi:uncharacterized protein (DUF697 family)
MNLLIAASLLSLSVAFRPIPFATSPAPLPG